MLQVGETAEFEKGSFRISSGQAECEYPETLTPAMPEDRGKVEVFELVGVDSKSQCLHQDRLGLISKSMTRLEDCRVTPTLLGAHNTPFVLPVDWQAVKSDECICEEMLVHLLPDFSRYCQESTYKVVWSICHCSVLLMELMRKSSAVRMCVCACGGGLVCGANRLHRPGAGSRRIHGSLRHTYLDMAI